ncbi:type I-U CRISPR-associated protein Csb2, partial [bacterium]|nr:type I-U CRISPR-associated protein Csb2 [bacterium]
MITIELKFPTGKLHATPWGRHVNEGAVEWPPSPWRFLRALLAVWHHKFHDVSEEEMRTLIAALSGTPSYHLPATSHGHTRHYMPAEHDKKTKIFDTFIAVSPDDPLVFSWPEVELDDTQQALLTKLLEALSYFGRAESWVIARLLQDYDGPLNAVPLNGHGVQKNQELVRLLSPTSESEHEQWRAKILTDIQQRALQEKQERERQKEKKGKKFTLIDKVKLTLKDINKLEATLPKTVFDALHAETNDLRKAGWNRPPASEWIDYVCDKQTAKFSKPKRSMQKETLPTVARYAVAGAVRPKLTQV